MKKVQKRIACMMAIIMLCLTAFSGQYEVAAAGEGGQTEGGQTEGGQTEGGQTEGGLTEGGQTEGGQTEDKKTGWQEIDGRRYYFDEAGVMQTGWFLFEEQQYYLGGEHDGRMRCNEWDIINGLWYHFDENGVMQTGWFSRNGSRYYLGGKNDGRSRCNEWDIIDGMWYHFDGSGAMQTGWLSLNGNWYYLGGANDGRSRCNEWDIINGIWYHFDGSGAMQTGWLSLNGNWYYLGGANDGRSRCNEWDIVDGKWYHFDGSGAMQIGACWINGHVYVLANSGEVYENGTYYVRGAKFTADASGVVVSCQLLYFPVIMQLPELPTGCEVTALTMAMHYYGYPVSKMTMAKTYLPQVHGNLYGVDLDEYFGGDPSERGTVCGPGALVTAANRYFEDCQSAMRGKNLMGYGANELYTRVANGQPIVVMSTIGMANRRSTKGWYTSTGKYVEWSTNDHGSVLIGWDATSVKIACPLYGIQTYSKAQFEKIYATRGYRSMTIE